MFEKIIEKAPNLRLNVSRVPFQDIIDMEKCATTTFHGMSFVHLLSGAHYKCTLIFSFVLWLSAFHLFLSVVQF